MSTDHKNTGVRVYPLDVRTLVKGMTIQIADLEEILNEKYTDPNWKLYVLSLKVWIEKELRWLGLPLLTMRSPRGTLHICTDAEAAVYNKAMGKLRLRAFRKSVARNVAVDTSNLTPDEQRDHERTLVRQAMLVRAITHAEKAKHPGLIGDGRVTPKMVAVG